MALAAVLLALALDDEAFLDELFQHAREALLGDPEDAQKIRDHDAWIASDEVDHPVMGAAEAVARKDFIRVAGEIAIGIEQQFDALANFLFAQKKRTWTWFYVSHVDIYGRECYLDQPNLDIFTKNRP